MLVLECHGVVLKATKSPQQWGCKEVASQGMDFLERIFLNFEYIMVYKIKIIF
jgi:hypothetical protein